MDRHPGNRKLNIAATEKKMHEHYIAAGPLPLIRTSVDAFLVLDRTQQASVKLSRRELQMLAECRRFRTIDQHVDHLATVPALQEVPQDQTRKALAHLLSQNLLVSSRTALTPGPAEVERSSRPSEISLLGIVTGGDPVELRRCAESHGRNLLEFDRKVPVVIVSSSRSPANTEELGRLRELPIVRDLPFRYIDYERRKQMAQVLARESGVPQQTVDFALLDSQPGGNDTGCNRNALLLHAVGTLFLSADDDTLADLRTTDQRPGWSLEVTSVHDPSRVSIFQSWESARQETVPLNECVLSVHERLLGKDLAHEARRHAPEDLQIRHLTAEAVWSLMRLRPRVRATFAGLFGDCGAPFPGFHLFKHPPVLPSEAADAERIYRCLAESRVVHRRVTAPTISTGAFSMTTNFAIDNRDLTPPFFPRGRGQDLLFGYLFRRSVPEALFGYLPASITHDPVPPRSQVGLPLWNVGGNASLPSIMLALAEGFQTRPSCPSERMRVLGQYFRELGSLAWPELEELAVTELWRVAAVELDTLRGRLARSGAANAHWSRDLARYIEHRASALAAPRSLIPPHLAARSDPAGGAVLQDLLRQFGALLEAWPALVSAASTLRTKQVTTWQEVAPA
jgi:hypothetical protein